MKINTKQKKNDNIPAPQIRVRSNIQSGAIVNPQITDLASPIFVSRAENHSKCNV